MLVAAGRGRKLYLEINSAATATHTSFRQLEKSVNGVKPYPTGGKSFPAILRGMADAVEAFGFVLVPCAPLFALFARLRQKPGQRAQGFNELAEGEPDVF